jgi:hypothetical protein
MCLSAGGQRGLAADNPSVKQIDQLIEELDSDRFEIREAAMRALKELVEAIPALRKARQSPNPEVRLRVEETLMVLNQKLALRSLRKARALAKEGRAVEIADRLAFAATCGASGEEGWESLTIFAKELSSITQDLFPDASAPGNRYYNYFPAGDFHRYVKLVGPKEIAAQKIEIDTGKKLDDPQDAKGMANRMFIRQAKGHFLLRGEEILLTGRVPVSLLNCGMIASSGNVRLSSALESLIVSGENIKQINDLRHCILICDGDVELLSPSGHDSLIVARGKVVCTEGKIQRCLVRSCGRTRCYFNGKESELKEGMHDPLAFVKFFELADVGLTAEDLPHREKADADGVLLKDMRKNSPFAAGLRKGDVITAVEDKKTPTIETFRRVLRRKLAEGGPSIILTLRRAGKSLDVSIPVKD